MSIYPVFDVNDCMTETETLPDSAHVLEESITIKGFSATYGRKFNLGNFESLNPAITVWVKTNVPGGAAFDLHDCKNRLRQMARDNVRAQLQRLQGNNEVVFLGLRPPASGAEDPIFVRTVSVSLGDYNSITPGYADWADVRHVAAFHGRIWALDSGNERTSGQVLIGNTTDVERIRLDPLGLCSRLPSPYLQEPGLLEPGAEARPLSCAGMMLADEQSLMVNRLAAAIAAQYATAIVMQQQVTQMGTAFNLEPTVMTPRLITAVNLGYYVFPSRNVQ